MKVRLLDLKTKRIIELPDIVKVTVGRNYESDISLSDYLDEEDIRGISRVHCIIDTESDSPYVVNFGRNGTYVNEERVDSSLGSVLTSGSILRLDNYEFKVFIEEPELISSGFSKRLAGLETVTNELGGANVRT